MLGLDRVSTEPHKLARLFNPGIKNRPVFNPTGNIKKDLAQIYGFSPRLLLETWNNRIPKCGEPYGNKAANISSGYNSDKLIILSAKKSLNFSSSSRA